MGTPARTTRHLLTPALAASVLLLGACSSGSSDADGSSTSSTSTSSSDATDTTASDSTAGSSATVDGSTGTAATGCPTDQFPDLSGSEGAGEGYAQPSLTVTCTDDRTQDRHSATPIPGRRILHSAGA